VEVKVKLVQHVSVLTCRQRYIIMILSNGNLYEFRCPVHGFIEIDEWERDIIAQPAFQRLRRIRQLGWTDYVYPGAAHTRFEHSLGVMHVATRLYDAISSRSKDVLRSAFDYNDDGLQRHRRVVRLAALLHDVGHGPFSHAVEELLPARPDGTKLKHEHYTAAFIRGPLKEVIEGHRINQNYGISADEIAALIEGSVKAIGLLFWRELIDSQMDADRMDYLLRDSHHLGVQYGRYDLGRLYNTICAVPGPDDEAPRVGVEEGGWHAAESLVLARYYMFTQVYFHRTRVAYDHHVVEAMKSLVPGSRLPSPVGKSIQKYMAWEDWRVLGMISAGKGGDHGRRLAKRDHYRMVYTTGEHQTPEAVDNLKRAGEVLGSLIRHEAPSAKSWYKLDKTGISVKMERGDPKMLSELSSPVEHIGTHDQTMLYTDLPDVPRARKLLEEAGL
jgi:uncharacterized protein